MLKARESSTNCIYATSSEVYKHYEDHHSAAITCNVVNLIKQREMAEGAVTFVLERLTTLWEKMREVAGVSTDVEYIKDELERMTAFVRVADAKEDTDVEMRTCVNQVHDVACDIEDVLDKFVLGLTRTHQNNRSIGVLCKCFDWIRNIKLNYHIVSEIKNIRSRVASISEGSQRYRYKFNIPDEGLKSDVRTNTDLTNDTGGDAALVEEADLVGIQRPKSKLMGWLVEGGSRLSVISVAGMGGLGKTTIAKKVYDDAQVKKHFQSHVWLTVSQLFKIEELLKGIIRQLFDEAKQAVPQGMDTMNSNQLKEVIKQFLKDRRYVLVFDDIWSIQAWDAIKYALPNNSHGSRVIVTTRLTDVAHYCIMGTDGVVYMLEHLTPEQSWILLCQKVFRASSCPTNLMEISHKILKRCAGLPLAINAVGGFLATKRNRYEDWVTLDQSLGAELDSNDALASLRMILLLSLNDLPYYLKSCLLYLAIYPEDHLINSNHLIRLWIMEGFVKPKAGRTLEQVAQGYLNELANKNLIQVARYKIDGSIKLCCIHDFLRELLVSKSRDHGFLMIVNEQTNDWIQKARCLSISGSKANFTPQKCGTKLRSLHAFGVTDLESMSSMHELLNSCKILKVLDLSGSPLELFPKVITKLFFLRSLSLRRTKIKSLPRSIKKLQNLEMLDLKQSCVTELPVEILQLQNLRHLIVYCPREYSYLPFDFIIGFKPPIGMGALTSLHNLSFIEATTPGILTELGKMEELRRLCILKLRREDGMELCSSIEKLQHLQVLSIFSTAEDEILDLDHIFSPPVSLERFYMTGRLENFPHWIKSLSNLVKVVFRWSHLTADPLEYLQDLPNLSHLDLLEAYLGEELCFRAGKFQRLSYLDLDKLVPLRQVIFEEGALSNLDKMIIQRCTCLENVPSGIERLSAITFLEFFDMPEEFVSKLSPDMVGGDYEKVAHIPEVYYTYWRGGAWEAHPLETGNEMGNSGRPKTSFKSYHQRNSL